MRHQSKKLVKTFWKRKDHLNDIISFNFTKTPSYLKPKHLLIIINQETIKIYKLKKFKYSTNCFQFCSKKKYIKSEIRRDHTFRFITFQVLVIRGGEVF